jgi:hypothetical protein
VSFEGLKRRRKIVIVGHLYVDPARITRVMSSRARNAFASGGEAVA